MHEYPEAAASFTLALDLYTRIGHRLGEAEVLNAIGDLLLATGTAREAHTRHEQALAIATGIGSLPQEAQALEGIGRCLMHERYSQEAIAPLRRALEIYESIGSPNANRVRGALVECTP